MEIPIQDIIDRIENNEILILDADNPYVAISNMLYRNRVIELIKAQAKEILDLQAAIVRVRTEKAGTR
tara:strand:- start:916 stop:1119 length:204 start_codon:yes stop_codon:yes gene_type:complete